MPDRTVSLWEKLYRYQADRRPVHNLNAGADLSEIASVEALVGTTFPEELKALYLAYNGESTSWDRSKTYEERRSPEDSVDEDEYERMECIEARRGTLFGHRFASLWDVRLYARLAEVENTHPPLDGVPPDPALVKEIIEKIVDYFRKLTNDTVWEKLTFSCSRISVSYPQMYPKASSEEHATFDMDTKEYFEKIAPLASELRELEYKAIDWDVLEFALFSNGDYRVERKDTYIPPSEAVTCHPEGAIKKKFSHPKWMPIFIDGGDNYIGCDLDPDVNGRKGQIIVFGPDHDFLYVVANSLGEFFQFFLTQLRKHEANGVAEPFTHSEDLQYLLYEMIVKKS